MENSIIQNFSFVSVWTNVFRAFKKTKYKRKDLYISGNQLGFDEISEATQYELKVWFGHITDDSCCIRYRHFIPAKIGFGGQGYSSFNFILRDINYNGDIFVQIIPSGGQSSPPYEIFLSQVLVNE